VTINTQPAPSGTGRVVLLRIQSPMLDVLTASFLAPDEARLLAEVLATAATAASAPAPIEPPALPSIGTFPGAALPREKLGPPGPLRSAPEIPTGSEEPIRRELRTQQCHCPPPAAQENGPTDPRIAQPLTEKYDHVIFEPLGTGGEQVEHIVSAAEETTAEELGRALASIPPGSRLTDFTSDVDVTLIFTSPAVTNPSEVSTTTTRDQS
jgi:uncharacterized repeat protein (TIGR03917 family)